jgi:hypothetical protein
VYQNEDIHEDSDTDDVLDRSVSTSKKAIILSGMGDHKKKETDSAQYRKLSAAQIRLLDKAAAAGKDEE